MDIEINDYEILDRANQFRDAADILKKSNKLIPAELNACLACELYLKYLVNFVKDNIQTKTKNQLVITCLAYTLNLGTCIPGPSEHLTKREFSKNLYDAIQKNSDKNISTLSSDEVFYYFESVIRGLMATWCFSNNSFSVVEKGKKYIPLAVYSIYTK